MKNNKVLTVAVMAAASVALILSGCGKQADKQSNKASMQNPVASKSAKSALLNHNNLWYMNGSINHKSKSGIDAYRFDKRNKTVTIYSVDKIYRSYAAAKKANALDAQGTLKYSFKNNSNTRPVINMKGKLSDIPMEQTVSVNGKVSGNNKESHLSVSGYKVVRDLDDDPVKQILVTPTK